MSTGDLFGVQIMNLGAEFKKNRLYGGEVEVMRMMETNRDFIIGWRLKQLFYCLYHYSHVVNIQGVTERDICS